MGQLRVLSAEGLRQPPFAASGGSAYARSGDADPVGLGGFDGSYRDLVPALATPIGGDRDSIFALKRRAAREHMFVDIEPPGKTTQLWPSPSLSRGPAGQRSMRIRTGATGVAEL